MGKLLLMFLFVVFCGCMMLQKETFAASEPVNVMTVKGVFSIPGRGVVTSGTISDGSISVGDKVEILRKDGSKRTVVVGAMEFLGKALKVAKKGDNADLLLNDLTKNDIGEGDIIRK